MKKTHVTKIVSIENLVIPCYQVLSEVSQHKFYRVGVDTYGVNIQCVLVPIFGDTITLQKTVYILRKWVSSNFYTSPFSAITYNIHLLLCSCRHCKVKLTIPANCNYRCQWGSPMTMYIKSNAAVFTDDNEFWNSLVSADSYCQFPFF